MPTINIVRVVLWMAGTLLSFSVIAVSIRELASNGFNLFDIFLVRSVGSLILLSPLFLFRPKFREHARPRRMPLNFARNIIHFASQYCWALGLTMLPLAMVFSLEFTMPAWTALLAAWILHERLTPSRIGVIVFGIVGVLVILRPGIAAINPGVFLVLLAAFGYAITMIMTKQLTNSETTFGIIFWMAIIQLPISLVGSNPAMFIELKPVHILPMLGIAIAGTGSHFCLSNAFRAGDATLVVPIDFLRIPLIAIVGWALYDESVDIFVFLGALIIISGVLWNLRAETARKT